MKLASKTDFSQLKNIDDIVNYMTQFSKNVEQVLSSLNFGDNFQSKLVTFNFAVANQKYNISHGLGTKPIGIIPIMLLNAAVLYDPDFGNSWTKDTIFLYSSLVGKMTFLVIGG